MRTLIIAISICVFAATVVTIIAGKRSFDGIVVEKPYETGLDWDRKQAQKARLGWDVSVNGTSFRTGRNELFITILDGNGKKVRDAAVNVKVSRPSSGAYDKTYEMALEPDGRYAASIDLSLYGNWTVIIDVRRGEDQTEFTKSIFAEKLSN